VMVNILNYRCETMDNNEYPCVILPQMYSEGLFAMEKILNSLKAFFSHNASSKLWNHNNWNIYNSKFKICLTINIKFFTWTNVSPTLILRNKKKCFCFKHIIFYCSNRKYCAVLTALVGKDCDPKKRHCLGGFICTQIPRSSEAEINEHAITFHNQQEAFQVLYSDCLCTWKSGALHVAVMGLAATFNTKFDPRASFFVKNIFYSPFLKWVGN
jgi:hypothetical protein